MSTSPGAPADLPPTVWLARGRHVGPAPYDALRRRLHRLRDDGTLDDFLDFLEPSDPEGAPALVVQARWRVEESVTVRARLSVTPEAGDAGEGQEWLLTAEAEQPWEQWWPSPATMFWPDEPEGPEGPDTGWDRDLPTGLRLLGVNRLPDDDKAVRHLFRDAVRGSWNIHVVVHEAMTPDDRGRQPLAALLPPGLRHRVVEHRAAPQQLRSVNWALKEIRVQVPRGGAVVLPRARVPSGQDAGEFAVRSVFLDGSRPADLVAALTRFAGSPGALPEGAGDAVAALREGWRLLTHQEELARERELVAMYAEALDAMTRSRDLYREAAERAHEALAAFRESADALPGEPAAPAASPFQQLTRTLERLKGNARPQPPRDEP